MVLQRLILEVWIQGGKFLQDACFPELALDSAAFSVQIRTEKIFSSTATRPLRNFARKSISDNRSEPGLVYHSKIQRSCAKS
jgi:hypothetical protein